MAARSGAAQPGNAGGRRGATPCARPAVSPPDRHGPAMNRRRFLGSLAASVVAGVGAARLVVDPQPRTFAQVPAGSVPTSGPLAPEALHISAP
ncbi:twin-arginine translocation signal domain-containing protein, partial [Mycobacterium helveticum]